MELTKIKNLIKRNGDKVILVENGEPELVLMSFQEYEEIIKNGQEACSAFGRKTDISPRNASRIETADLSGEKLKETEFILSPDGGASSSHVRLEDIRLEDLPI